MAQAQLALQQVLDAQDNERLDDEGGGLLSGPNTRIALMQKLQRDVPSMGMHGTGANMVPVAPSQAAYHHTAPMMPAVHSANVVLSNMFGALEIEEDGEAFYEDICEDVKNECGKLGNVVSVWVNKKAIEGKVWVKFASVDQAMKAQSALNGRHFGGNMISVESVSDSVWLATCV